MIEVSKQGDVDPEEVALFRREMEGVRRLRHDRAGPFRGAAPGGRGGRRRLAEAGSDRAVPAWSDAFEPAGAEVGEVLFFARAGVQRSVVRKLRRGGFRPEGDLDLHGHTQAQARDALGRFLDGALERGARCVRVVHGKGYSSPRGPVIKGCVDRWLRQCPEVVAFCSAQPADGGTGAVYVLLRRHRG